MQTSVAMRSGGRIDSRAMMMPGIPEAGRAVLQRDHLVSIVEEGSDKVIASILVILDHEDALGRRKRRRRLGSDRASSVSSRRSCGTSGEYPQQALCRETNRP